MLRSSKCNTFEFTEVTTIPQIGSIFRFHFKNKTFEGKVYGLYTDGVSCFSELELNCLLYGQRRIWAKFPIPENSSPYGILAKEQQPTSTLSTEDKELLTNLKIKWE